MSHEASIKRLFLAGDSYLEIAAALGLTKGQVAGKCKRMGLVRAGSTKAGMPRGKLRVVPREPVTFAELAPISCRYPMGDSAAGLKFCGDVRVEGSSYCKNHHSVCHQKSGRAA